jgi:hypothetical protein
MVRTLTMDTDGSMIFPLTTARAAEMCPDTGHNSNPLAPLRLSAADKPWETSRQAP